MACAECRGWACRLQCRALLEFLAPSELISIKTVLGGAWTLASEWQWPRAGHWPCRYFWQWGHSSLEQAAALALSIMPSVPSLSPHERQSRTFGFSQFTKFWRGT